MRGCLQAPRKPGESFVKQFLQTSVSLALVLGIGAPAFAQEGQAPAAQEEGAM